MENCKRCGTAKPDDDFYAGDKTCKACRRASAKEYRKTNIEKVLAYDRDRSNKEKRKADVRRRYRKQASTPEGRNRLREHARKWAQNYRNSDKRAAHVITGNAVRDGILVPGPCAGCGSTEHIHGHHEDYYKPLEVIWLCRTCHGKKHREINTEKRHHVG